MRKKNVNKYLCVPGCLGQVDEHLTHLSVEHPHPIPVQRQWTVLSFEHLNKQQNMPLSWWRKCLEMMFKQRLGPFNTTRCEHLILSCLNHVMGPPIHASVSLPFLAPLLLIMSLVCSPSHVSECKCPVCLNVNFPHCLLLISFRLIQQMPLPVFVTMSLLCLVPFVQP